MSRKTTATRAELATLLWGSCPDQQARQSLRQALVLLRKDLGSPNALFADKEVVRLHPGAWFVDALEFEASANSTISRTWSGRSSCSAVNSSLIRDRGGRFRRLATGAA